MSLIPTVPDLPPQNISAENTENLAIIVRWKPIPDQKQNGIILGYRLTSRTMSAIGNLKEPRDTDTDQWQRFAKVVDKKNVYFEVLRDVIPFTWYCIRMLGFTRKGGGPESSCEFILTEEGGKIKQCVPVDKMVTHNPFNFICSCCDFDGLVTMQPDLVLTRSKKRDDIQK